MNCIWTTSFLKRLYVVDSTKVSLKKSAQAVLKRQTYKKQKRLRLMLTTDLNNL